MKHLSLCKTWALLLVFVLTVGVVGATAQHAAAGNPDKNKTPQSAIDIGGQQAAVDAKGKLRQPTPEEAQALVKELSAKLDQPFDDSKVIRMADGAVAVFTGDSDMNFMVMKANPDGTFSIRCVENKRQLQEFFDLTKPTKTEAKRDANGLEVE